MRPRVDRAHSRPNPIPAACPRRYSSDSPGAHAVAEKCSCSPVSISVSVLSRSGASGIFTLPDGRAGFHRPFVFALSLHCEAFFLGRGLLFRCHRHLLVVHRTSTTHRGSLTIETIAQYQERSSPFERLQVLQRNIFRDPSARRSDGLAFIFLWARVHWTEGDLQKE